MVEKTHGETALRLMAHYARHDRGQCSCLDLPHNGEHFTELTERLGKKVRFDPTFIAEMLRAMKENNFRAFEAVYPAMCQDLALRMFLVFLEARQYDTYEEIVATLSSGTALPIPKEHIEALVRFGMNKLMGRELTVQVN